MMTLWEGDHVEFYDARNRPNADGITRGRVLLLYTPPVNLGRRSDGVVLVRVDVGYGGWCGGDGYYYWYVPVEKLTIIDLRRSTKRPISPIFYEVRV